MPSLRARFVNGYIRRKMKVLPLPDIEPTTLRRLIEGRVLPFQPRGVAIETVDGAVRGEWQTPPTPSARVIYYLHGGGYVFGSPRTHRSLTMRLGARADARVFSLDYRLAPEHPCPAAIEDALAGWRFLLDSGVEPADIVVSGDSAGGGLALAMMQALIAEGAATPAGAVLYSPWTDLAATGASIAANDVSDAMFTADTIRRGGPKYAGDLRLDDPRVSPLYGEMRGLPPTLVFASTAEVLRDDSSRLVEKMQRAGVDVSYTLEDGLVHVWPVFAPLMPEALAAIDQSAAFIGRVTERKAGRAG